MAFLDDDAVAEPGWLARARRSTSRDPTSLGVGGLTLPAWETSRPRWWPEEFDWVVGCTFVGRRPGPCANLPRGQCVLPARGVRRWRAGFRTHIGRPRRARARWAARRPSSASERADGGRVAVRLRADGRDPPPGPARPGTLRLLPVALLRRGPVQGPGHRSVGVRTGWPPSVPTRRVTAPGVPRGLRQALRGDPAGLAPRGGDRGGLRCDHGRVRRRARRSRERQAGGAAR